MRRGLRRVLFPEVEGTSVWHPLLARLRPGEPALDWSAHRIYKPQDPEVFGLTGMPLAELGSALARTRTSDPRRVERFFVELREEFDEVRGTRLESELAKALPAFEPHLPADLWQLHLGDIDPTPVDLAVRSISMSPLSARAGEIVVFSAEIVNNGTGEAAPFTVQLKIDDTAVESVSVSALAPRTVTTVQFRAWTATEGTHTVVAMADASARIAEPTEDDNALKSIIAVSP